MSYPYRVLTLKRVCLFFQIFEIAMLLVCIMCIHMADKNMHSAGNNMNELNNLLGENGSMNKLKIHLNDVIYPKVKINELLLRSK